MRVALLSAALAGAAFAAPHYSSLKARRLLGSSFGVPGDNRTFDYVVVGGGTAGLTIATRLVEAKAGTVAVIEAGSFYEIFNSNISQVPATDGAFAGKGEKDWQPLIDWGYMTTPQVGALNDSIHYTRGKALGGSSARNYMLYQRGTESSYDMWAEQVGDDTFKWESFKPYFEKSITYSPPREDLRFTNATPSIDDCTLGREGPLSVIHAHYAQAFATWATKGFTEMGIDIIPGFLNGSLLGQSYATFTINANTSLRDSSETAFLQRSLNNPNYTVYTRAMAKRLLFNSDPTPKVTGVLVDTEGFEYILSARKEVILTAGVFGSPQLLQVSGIGPAEVLEPAGVPILVDLPGVGRGMQDHIYFGVSHRVNAPTLSALQFPDFAAKQAVEFNTRAAGMYSNPTSDAVAWEKVPAHLRSSMSNSTLSILSQYPEDWPEIEYISMGAFVGFQEDSRRGDPGDGFNYATLVLALCTPRSRGTVTITSPDTYTAPEINPNFLVEQADVDVSVAAFKRAREFWATDALADFKLGDESFPGIQVESDAQILETLQRSYNTIYHGACTCAMGRSNDSMAVVDTEARVFGVHGLRVVDASSFPLLPPGHPQATVLCNG
ncbi:glucose-methanol-choline oxidoreductase [Paraphaeosphaeria sporulosa]|uniref:Glucose-methanol-choline oxidoreductase n=1 Tax=Paraphaeosphaeria sporulosa TaxID=1460663 RepID=A0A177C2G5_9PLEO|nr:glucose-methanol-choline oxidoreductase [Paraphaeosphaeria sporulosa]OAG01984.1 glucose-methanol-choline oxidoreductase [Paraphaeosphaeria sporulosa]